jgi:predicted deacylase
MYRSLCATLALLLLFALSAGAEKNLVRPLGTTRYAPMVARLHALLDYDQAQGAHRMALTSIGQSVEGRQICMVTLHGGPKKIFFLCRQHGHEPASTEGALAFLDQLLHAAPGSALDGELQQVTVYIVPMANPDGAEAFRRHNAHNVDLNRDWIAQTQPETRAWVRAIKAIHPDLFADQHELYPDDTRPDFTETAGLNSLASANVIATCLRAQSVVQGALLAEGFPTVMHQIVDHHPPRLAHRYVSMILGIPAVLFETNRLTASHRTVAERADAHTQFMLDMLREEAGQQNQMIAEAATWRAAHPRETETLLASRQKAAQRRAHIKPAPLEKSRE